MKQYKLICTIDFKLRPIIVFFLLFFISNSTFTQSCSIKAVGFNGKPASSVKLTIFKPGKGAAPQTGLFSPGLELSSGTKIILPPNTIVQFMTKGGTQIVRSKSNDIGYTVSFSEKGEAHTVQGNGAEIKNTVKKLLGYSYTNTNEKGVTAAITGTIFTFTNLEDNQNEAILATEEGTITIIEERPVRIKNAAGNPGYPNGENYNDKKIKKSVERSQSVRDGSYTSGDAPVEYDNYEEAISAMSAEINDEANRLANACAIAVDLICLGELYMSTGQTAKAIKELRRAVRYFESKDYSDDMTIDMETIVAKLYLAGALLKSETEAEQSEGRALNASCISSLQDALVYEQEDYNYAKNDADEDVDEATLICDDIHEIYLLLSIAYSIAEDEDKATQYSKKAEKKGCDQ